MKSVGIDIGGTKIAAAIVEDGKILNRIEEKTDPKNLVLQIEEIIKTLDAEGMNIGIGMAGQIADGIVKHSPNLSIDNLPLSQQLEERLKVKVTLVNDVQAAAWGEVLHGAAKNINRGIVAFLGTGIGGAIFSEGIVWGGTAGEIGHMVIFQDGVKCNCGNKGCLEAYAGGWGLAKQAGKQHAREVFEKDPHIVQQGFKALVTAFSNLTTLLNPDVILVGGGLLEGYEKAIPHFIEKLEKEVKEKAIQTSGDRLTIKRATLGLDAGIIGSAST